MREAGGDGYSPVQRIPSLAEYLRVAERYGKVAVVELKNEMSAEWVEEVVRTCAREYDLEQVIFISFHYANLEAVLARHPRQKVQFLTGEYSGRSARKARSRGDGGRPVLQGTHRRARPRLPQGGRRGQLLDVRRPEDAARLISWGVDMITTNILQ